MSFRRTRIEFYFIAASILGAAFGVVLSVLGVPNPEIGGALGFGILLWAIAWIDHVNNRAPTHQS
jgi:hypothetical protein